MMVGVHPDTGKLFAVSNNEAVGWGATPQHDGASATMHLSASIVRAVGTSVVWLNDVVHHGPVVGGTLWTLGGRRLGLSDADGIVRSTTVTDGTVVVTAGAVAPGTGTAPGGALLVADIKAHGRDVADRDRDELHGPAMFGKGGGPGLHRRARPPRHRVVCET